MRRRLFKYSARRIILWTVFYGVIIATVVSAVALTNHYLHERTSDISGQVSLSLQKTKFELDEEVQFSVVNDSGGDVVINNDCPQEPLMVYFWDDSKWERVHEYISEEACPDQDREITVKSRQTLTGSYSNWQKLFNKPGIYRIAVVVNGYSGLAFQDIEVVNSGITTPVVQPVLEQKSIQIEERRNYERHEDEDEQEED